MAADLVGLHHNYRLKKRSEIKSYGNNRSDVALAETGQPKQSIES
jgi:hypothetical protein